MEIEIRFRGMDHWPAFVEHATRRIEHYLGRYGRQVSRVVLRVTDVNGPRGGDDKRCHVAIRGPVLGTVTLVESQPDAHAAAELVLHRARRVLGEALGRSPAGAPTLRRGALHLRLMTGEGR